MYAIVACCGKQFKVSVGRQFVVESKLEKIGDVITLPVLFHAKDEADGGFSINPKTMAVVKIMAHKKGEKIKIVKFRRRKHQHKETGYRPVYTHLQVESFKEGNYGT